MASAEIPMPPALALQEDLRTTTERIAQELAAPLVEAPDWSDIQWRVAMAVAVMHGVAPMLAVRLRWPGPDVWRTFLGEQRAQSILRQRRTQRLLADIDAASRQARVPLVALKGSVLLGMALYGPGERPMSDIDLLCAKEDFSAADRLVGALGYVPALTNRRHRQYVPEDTGEARCFGEHMANPVKIELHGHIAERLPLREVDITAQIFPDQPSDGLNPYPSSASLMRHLLLHAAGNLRYRGIRLIHLHDIAALAVRMRPEDWEALMRPGPAQPDPWWVWPPLTLVNRLFPRRIPEPILKRAAAACPGLLRRSSMRCRIDDVSLSRLASPVLPGWEWSRSLTDVVLLAYERLSPDREVVGETTPMGLDHFSLTSPSWTRLPRWDRALRILAGRAPRAATMYSVRRALDYGPAAASVPYSASTRVKV